MTQHLDSRNIRQEHVQKNDVVLLLPRGLYPRSARMHGSNGKRMYIKIVGHEFAELTIVINQQNLMSLSRISFHRRSFRFLVSRSFPGTGATSISMIFLHNIKLEGLVAKYILGRYFPACQTAERPYGPFPLRHSSLEHLFHAITHARAGNCRVWKRHPPPPGSI